LQGKGGFFNANGMFFECLRQAGREVALLIAIILGFAKMEPKQIGSREQFWSL
jgi:hypothetical protein